MIDEKAVSAQARALTPGEALPVLVRRPTRVTCFLFAVAWWAPHRVHYDIELARAEGYRDVMVPGLLLNEYVVTALTSWTGDPTTLRRMTIRNMAPAFAGDELIIEGRVADVAETDKHVAVTFDFTIANDTGTAVASGRATVEVPAAER